MRWLSVRGDVQHFFYADGLSPLGQYSYGARCFVLFLHGLLFVDKITFVGAAER